MICVFTGRMAPHTRLYSSGSIMTMPHGILTWPPVFLSGRGWVETGFESATVISKLKLPF